MKSFVILVMLLEMTLDDPKSWTSFLEETDADCIRNDDIKTDMDLPASCKFTIFYLNCKFLWIYATFAFIKIEKNLFWDLKDDWKWDTWLK